jgi:hypothetical protein
MKKAVIAGIIIGFFVVSIISIYAAKEYMISNIIEEKEFLISQKTTLENIEANEKSEEELHNINNMIKQFDEELKFWNSIP